MPTPAQQLIRRHMWLSYNNSQRTPCIHTTLPSWVARCQWQDMTWQLHQYSTYLSQLRICLVWSPGYMPSRGRARWVMWRARNQYSTVYSARSRI